MDTVQNYKCPCCGASLVFGADEQNLVCESCGNSFPLDTMKDVAESEIDSGEASKYDWENYVPRSYEDNSKVNFAGYSCPSCGAQISGDDTIGATVCPYCGNATIVKGQFEGTLKPDYIIPFKLDKKAAMKAFEEDLKKAPFVPDGFKNKKKIEEMSGVYVPFWMFDCDCEAAVSYSAQRITSWSDREYDYTKTDYYKLFRKGSIGFENIPVDGSKKADDTYMEALEPYNYADAVNFSDAYLAGYFADKYDVSVDESIERANERVKNSTINAFANTTDGYLSVSEESSRLSFSNGKIRYSLLPVWMLNMKYMDNMYNFAINGQTGKVVGAYPVDKGKKWRYFAKVAGIALAIMSPIVYLFIS